MSTTPYLKSSIPSESLYFDPVNLTPVLASERLPSRRYLTLQQAYDQVSREQKSERGSKADVLSSKREWLERQLDQVEEKVRDVSLNFAEACDSLDAAAAEAKKKLESITRDKLETCCSLEVEMRRQLEQMEWLDSKFSLRLKYFGDEQQTQLDTVTDWRTHSLLKNSLSRSKPHELQSLSTIQPDLRISCNIDVFIDPFLTSPSPSPSKHPMTKTYPFTSSTAIPVENFLPSPLQSLVDEEAIQIQKLIQKSLSGDGLSSLPMSIALPGTLLTITFDDK